MAHYQLAVEIDNSRLVSIAPIERDRKSGIDLTTIEPDQRRAIVKVFAVSSSGRVELTSFDVSQMPHGLGRKTRLRLQARVDADKRLRLALYVEDRLFARRELPIRRYLGGPSPLGIAAAIFLFLLLGGTVVYLAVGRPGDRSPGGTEPPGEEVTEQQAEEGAADNGAAGVAGVAGEAGEAAAGGNGQAGGGSAGTSQAGQAAEAEAGEPEQAGDTPPEPAGDAQTDEPDTGAASVPPDPDAELAGQQWTIYFEPESAALTPDAAGALERIVETLEPADSIALRIVGHTALFGTERGRVELSRERAAVIAEFLRSRLGTDAIRYETSGVGGQSPITEDRGRQDLNRRVEITVSDSSRGEAP